ncbi:hypothetical protein [Cohnella yongneupensis]|uniref:Uncharacterized protein n=1 Tax=Cohnella yongneupensis TaxID=425006 RepID=A0ABW0QU13_9BACL
MAINTDHPICCIKSLMELKKEDGEDFPPICPYAYAYVFWRKSLLKLEYFYRQTRGDEIKLPKLYGLEFATKLIHDELKYYRLRFLDYSTLTLDKQEAAVNWLLNRVTAEFCISFFKEWLEIAHKGTLELKVPNWNNIVQMKVISFPKIAFNFNVYDSNGKIECILKNSVAKLPVYDCPYNTIKKRRALKKMRTHHPLNVAMKVFDCPNNENLQLKSYVDFKGYDPLRIPILPRRSFFLQNSKLTLYRNANG